MRNLLPAYRYCMGLILPLMILVLAACYAPAPVSTSAPPSAPTPTNAPADLALGEARLAWTRPVGEAISWAPQVLKPGSDSLLIVAPDFDLVVALDLANGREVWRYQPGDRLWADSVTVVGDGVYVAMEGARLVMLDGNTGQVRWQGSLHRGDAPQVAGLEARGRPAWTKDTLFVPTAGVGSRATTVNPQLAAPLVALDRNTGGERWRATTENYILRALFADEVNERVYVGGARLPDSDIDEGGLQRIYALSAETGEVEWAYDSLDGLTKSLWAGEGVVVFVAYRDFLVGIEATSGTEVWRQHTGNWVQSFAALPLGVDRGRPAIAFASANGFLNLFDPADGGDIWRFNLPGTFNYPMGNAVMAGETVYFITQQGDLYALDAADGSQRWMLSTDLESRDGVAVAAGRLFVAGAGGTVVAYDLP